MGTKRLTSDNRPGSTALMIVIMACCVCGTLSVGWAQTRGELRERMRQRYVELVELKDRGVVGETYLGFVSPVDPNETGAEAARLSASENEDRRALYEIIAEETGATVEAVGKINARRIFEDADEEHYFKGPEGEWRRKKAIEDGFWRPG